MADVTIDAAAQAEVTIVTAGRRARNSTGGATLTAGSFVYSDSADGELKGAINTAATTAACVGILLAPTTDGNNATYAYQDDTEVDVGVTLTEGSWYVISSTAGAVHPYADLQAGEFLSWAGYGLANGNLNLKIINTGVAKS
jgi:hypothetical protein